MASQMACWESSADDMDPPPTSAAACLFRGLNDRGEVFCLSWGRTSLDPLDRYTVESAMKSASFASQIVYTYYILKDIIGV